ncbi:MAG: PAS domain S-box protein [Bacteroidia bacterium]|nr:PAS domain S-box protein [Bacteroidia bacterium]
MIYILKLIRFIVTGIIMLFYLQSAAQHDIISGKPYVSYFSPMEYKAHPQNWAIVQDTNGIIYFANNQFILQYDGAGWRIIPGQFASSIRTLAINNKGEIYVGANNTFGVLKVDSIGNLHFVSLMNKISGNVSEIGEIRRILPDGNDIWLVGTKKLVCLSDKIVRMWNPETSFLYGFFVYDNLFVWQEGRGIMQISGNSLKILPGSEIFSDKVVHFMLPFKDSSILVGTRNNGLYLIRNFSKAQDTQENFIISQYNTPFDDYLFEYHLYHGIRLSTGDYALATDYGGVIILTGDGQLKEVINRKTGLGNETVNYVYEDKDKNLWIALNIGIAVVSLNAQIRHYGEEAGLNDIVTSVIQYKQNLYVGTMQGIFRLEEYGTLNLNKEPAYKFQKIEGLNNTCMDIKEINGELYVATSEGIMKISENRNKLIFSNKTGITIHKYINNNSFIFIGVFDGLLLFKTEGSELSFIGKINGITTDIRNIEEDSYGNLWLADQMKGLFHLSYGNESPGLSPVITKIDSTQGIPEFINVVVFRIEEKILINVDSGLYSYNVNSPDPYNIYFFKETSFPLKQNPEDVDNINYSRILQLSDGNIWAIAATKIFLLKKENETYTIWDIPFRFIPTSSFFCMDYDKINHKLWFGGSNGLYCYYTSDSRDYKGSFHTLIRRVYTRNDSVIFNGSSVEMDIPLIEYNDNHLIFEFALPWFEAEKETEYSFILEGFMKEWSEWKKEPKAEFTNIPDGRYIFRAKARNVYKYESQEATFEFKILKPWYKSLWAIILFSIIFLLIIYLIIILYSKRLKRTNIKLEKIVAERTNQISFQKMELQTKQEELEIINSELQKFTIVARETNNAVMIMDTNGYFEWVNEGFTRLYGYTLLQLITEKSTNIFDYSMTPNVRDILNECISEKKSMIYESVIITRSGEKKWTQTTLTPILDNNGNVFKIVAIDSDINKIKQAEEEILLQHEEIVAQRDQLKVINKELEKLSIVARETGNAVIIMDAEGNFEWLNESLTRLYGYTLEQFIEKKGRNIVDCSSSPDIKNILKKCIVTKKTVTYESLTNTATGRTFWTHTTITPILDEEGNITRLVAIDTDISKIKQAELEIIKQKEQIQAQSDLLVQTNKELEKNNQYITDSIRYAKRIQEAILSSEEQIRQYLPDMFVFQKPKDIVSGDFYWATTVFSHVSDGVTGSHGVVSGTMPASHPITNAESRTLTSATQSSHHATKLVIAVADCTGHGVPGAFMSLIGNNILNEIVKERGITTPSGIIDRLNTKLSGILKQGEKSLPIQDDGMDISICTIDIEKRQLQIACANQSVLIIQKGTPQIIKGEMTSIGGIFTKITGEAHFKNHKINIEQSTMLYLFTDGFRDQFGGQENKKFSDTQFFELILGIYNTSMHEQYKKLEKAFEIWKADKKQTDDILVVGLKLNMNNLG